MRYNPASLEIEANESDSDVNGYMDIPVLLHLIVCRPVKTKPEKCY